MEPAVSPGRGLKIVAAAAALSLLGLVALIIFMCVRADWTYRYAITRLSLQEIADDLRRYHERHGAFPAGLKVADLKIPHLPNPEDGWGYVLNVTEHGFTLTSWALDGKPGGEGHDQDIVVSWDPKGGLNIQAADISP